MSAAGAAPLLGLMLLTTAAQPVAADVVYLQNGSRLRVYEWRETDDAFELVVAGGFLWIDKAEVIKIEEMPGGEPALALGSPDAAAQPEGAAPTSGVLPPPAPPAVPRVRLDTVGAVSRMLALLKQGEALFADTLLSPAQKVRAVRWLDERWRDFDVPEPLLRWYGAGVQALRQAGDAFAAQGEGLTEATLRMTQAVGAVRGVEAALRDGSLEPHHEEDVP
jgi:hypothetical protein